MFEDFTTIQYLLSYPGMILAVVLLTQATKRMFDRMGPNQTRFVALGFTIIFCIFALFINMPENPSSADIAENVLVWFVNAVIVWMAATKSYETVKGDKTPIVHVTNTDPDSDVYKEAIKAAEGLLGTYNDVRIKQSPANFLNRNQ